MNKRWAALLLAVVPGLGHLYLGRPWRGILLFTLFAAGANGVFFVLTAAGGREAPPETALFAGGAAAAWAYSLLHVAQLGRRSGNRSIAERKDYHLRRGLGRYLAGDFEAAKTELLLVLALDPADADARFHLGMTYKALGDHRRAVRSFRRCLDDDLDAKWKWEIDTELARFGGPK